SRLGSGRRQFGLGGGPVWIATLLAVLSVLSLSVGVLQKEHCRAKGWTTPDQFWHLCYSDIPVLYGSAGLGARDAPTLVQAVGKDGLGQPPLAGAAMWLVSRAVDGTAADASRVFFDLSAVVLVGLLAAAAVAVALAAGRRPWDAAQVAAAPILVTVGLVSYDLLAVALTAFALLAWSRRRPVIGGVLLGLSMATRPVTAAVLIAVLALAVRTGRIRPVVGFCLPALGAWLATRLVLLPGATGGISNAFDTWRAAGPGYGSIWLLPSLLSQSKPGAARVWYTGGGLGAGASTVAVLMGLTVIGLATLILGLSTTDRPRLAHLALFALAGTLLVTKSLPVQAPLVLLPLLALAGLRWRDHLIWATTEATYFVGVWLYIAFNSDPNKGLPAGFYLILLIARVAGIVWVMAQAVRAMRDPEIDPVRVPEDGAVGADDPQGGELDGAHDALVLRVV
ncbi:MAG TPA: hypothetical protein VHN80_26215, partial [Kineosporiaceae bacterium]|nr:hypothetical protein [Kineosporiaceae bacterium]